MRVASVVGTRPQFMKVAPVSEILRQQHEEVLIHTGQHYDYAMSAQFFEELALPRPDYDLECGSGSHGTQTARMLTGLEEVFMQEHIDQVIVYGDTNSTLAGVLAASKLHIPIAHVEAGLRSFNRSMPEEINRVVADHLADQLYCPTEAARRQLYSEGIYQGVEVVGDVMYDTLLRAQPHIAEHFHSLTEKLRISSRSYVLTTVHRGFNADTPAALEAIAEALNSLGMPVIFPVHPRTQASLQKTAIRWEKHIQLIEPVGYLDMLALERHAHCIVTDSGGVQKEAFLLSTPCITLREETEWRETVELGWNVLVGHRLPAILAALSRPRPQPPQYNPFGEGDAAQRIVHSLQRKEEQHAAYPFCHTVLSAGSNGASHTYS